MKLLWNCSEIALKLLWNIMKLLWNIMKLLQKLYKTALKLLWNCTETALKLLLNCPKNALKVLQNLSLELLWNCTEIALKLLWKGSEIALKLLWKSLVYNCWFRFVILVDVHVFFGLIYSTSRWLDRNSRLTAKRNRSPPLILEIDGQSVGRWIHPLTVLKCRPFTI